MRKTPGEKAEGLFILFFFITGAYLFPGLFFGMIYFVPTVFNIYIQFIGHVDSY